MLPVRRSLRAFAVLSAALLLSIGVIAAPRGASAQDMAMTGQPLNAEQALRWGLVKEITTPDTLLAKTWEPGLGSGYHMNMKAIELAK